MIRRIVSGWREELSCIAENVETQKRTPATAEEFFSLAEQYREAAKLLLQQLGKSSVPASHAPWRLTAIHAVELYLNALLLHAGLEHKQIKGMHHNLSERAKQVTCKDLQLKKKTTQHLNDLTANSEYTSMRYGPLMSTKPQINRLTATLEKIATKTAKKTGMLMKTSR